MVNLRSADCFTDINFEWGSLVCVLGHHFVKILANDLHYDIGEVLTKLPGEAKRKQDDNVKY